VKNFGPGNCTAGDLDPRCDNHDINAPTVLRNENEEIAQKSLEHFALRPVIKNQANSSNHGGFGQ
jgi:hypothetical protein